MLSIRTKIVIAGRKFVTFQEQEVAFERFCEDEDLIYDAFEVWKCV